MSQDRSLVKILKREYLDDFADAIKRYRQDQNFIIDIDDDDDSFEDIRINKVHVRDGKNDFIHFVAVVEMDVPKLILVRGDRVMDINTKWYSISCDAEVDSGLRNLQIRNVSDYHSGSIPKSNLTDALVPYIKTIDLDRHAEEFLRQYYPEALRAVVPVNPLEVVRRMGLTVEMRNLSSGCTIFGQVFFRDCTTTIYNSLKNAYEEIPVNKGTIMVDPEVFFMRNVGSVNNTIIHECVHWHKHKKSFELANDTKSAFCKISCQVLEGNSPSRTEDTNAWMEWQANALAPRILMPIKQFQKKANELINRYKVDYRTEKTSAVMEDVIRDIADFFQVSLQSARFRMVDAGYNEALGHFAFVDDGYAENIEFKPGSLNRGQTFAISFGDSLVQYAMNSDFRNAIKTGSYVYVDKYFCINDPKYVQDNGFGKLMLTTYARKHADECLLVFDLQKRDNPDWCGRKQATECMLFRDAYAKQISEAVYENSAHNQAVVKKSAEVMVFSKTVAEAAELIERMPSKFSKALDMLIRHKGLTNEKMAELTYLDERTIRRLRTNEDSTSLKTVVALCIGLKLNPSVSRELIRRSGCSFKPGNSDHIACIAMMRRSSKYQSVKAQWKRSARSWRRHQIGQTDCL